MNDDVSGERQHRRGGWGRRIQNLQLADAFEKFQEDVERMFQDRFRGTPLHGLGFDVGKDGGFPVDYDMCETDEDIRIKVDLPGVSEADIDVSLSDTSVCIKGRRQRVDETYESVLHKGRDFGDFTRRIALPCEIDADAVDARLKKGVLTVTLPKSVSVKQNERKITVHS